MRQKRHVLRKGTELWHKLMDPDPEDAALDPDPSIVFPQVRADCRNVPRPCPFVRCTWHTYLRVNPYTGSIWINFPDVAPWELKDSCVLDVAERGDLTLDLVGTCCGLTKERVRQLEGRALETLRLKLAEAGVTALDDVG